MLTTRFACPFARVKARELEGGPCISLIHTRRNDQIGQAYEKIIQFAHQQQYQITMPGRELYLKGPGMILEGNPKKYITEIQMLIANPKNLPHA